MNIEIARKRYMDVIRPDVMHNTQGDFLATHVPMKKLYVTEHLTDHADVPEQDKKRKMYMNNLWGRRKRISLF